MDNGKANRALALAKVFDELDGMEGLGEELEVVAALARTGEDLDRSGLTAEEHDTRVGEEFLDGDGGFHAVKVRHEDVGEDDLGSDAAGGLDGFLAAIRSHSGEPTAIENLHDGVGDDCFVVYDEDARERIVVVILTNAVGCA
jgi:hypothetical protein